VLRKFNLKEVAELVGVSAKTITRAVQRNELPAGERVRGNRLLFTLEEIHEIQERLGLRPGAIRHLDKASGGRDRQLQRRRRQDQHRDSSGQHFALRGYRVLMIDLDAQASLTTLFGLLPDSEVATEQTALPYLEGETDTLADAIQPTYWHGLDLIAANLALYGAEFSLANRQKSEPNFRFYQALKAGIATVSDRYDVIVIDTPPALSYVTTNALYAADGIIVPVPPAMMDFASASLFFSLLGDIQKVIDENEGGEKVFDFLGLADLQIRARQLRPSDHPRLGARGLSAARAVSHHGHLHGAAHGTGNPDRLRGRRLPGRSAHARPRPRIPRGREWRNRAPGARAVALESHSRDWSPRPERAAAARMLFREQARRTSARACWRRSRAAERAEHPLRPTLLARALSAPRDPRASRRISRWSASRCAKALPRASSASRPSARPAWWCCGWTRRRFRQRVRQSPGGSGSRTTMPSFACSRKTSAPRASSIRSACALPRGSGFEYEIVYGHRRHAACLALDAETRRRLSGAGAARCGLRGSQAPGAADARRERRARGPVPYEYGRMYQSWLSAGLFETQGELAAAVGRDDSPVSMYVQIAELPAEVLAAFADPREISLRWAPQLMKALKDDREHVLGRPRAPSAGAQPPPLGAETCGS
jgi:excisionase family DNA binding protein